MNHHLNNWLDKAEGKPVGSSNAGINKERARQGYKKVVAKKMKTGTNKSNQDRNYLTGHHAADFFNRNEASEEAKKIRTETNAEGAKRNYKEDQSFNRAFKKRFPNQ